MPCARGHLPVLALMLGPIRTAWLGVPFGIDSNFMQTQRREGAPLASLDFAPIAKVSEEAEELIRVSSGHYDSGACRFVRRARGY